jgi:hypothetical protein
VNWERMAWVVIGVAAVALERHTLKTQSEERNDTASEMTRIIFRTDSLVGKTVFEIVARGTAEWFIPHTSSQGSIRRMKGHLNVQDHG